MNVTLVNPKGANEHFTPLHLCYIAGALRSAFGKSIRISIVDILDTQTIDFAVEKILASNPEIVGFTTYTALFELISESSKILKNRHRKSIIWGGAHISVLPHQLPSFVDIGVLGPGEETITKLLEVYSSNNGRFPAEKLAGINGISYHGEAEAVVVQKKESVKLDLNKLPKPDYSLLSPEHWKPQIDWLKTGEKIIGASIISSRGCAFRCTFCQEAALYRKVSFMEAEKLVEIVSELYQKYGATYFVIEDVVFGYTPAKVQPYIDALAKRNLLGKVNFCVLISAPNLTEDLARSFVEMGVTRIRMGLETGSKKMIKILKPGPFSVESNLNALEIARRFDLFSLSYFILGAPGETIDDLNETYQFIESSPLDLVTAGYFVPMPSTPLWNQLLKAGKVSENMDWRQLSFRLQVEETMLFNDLVPRDEFIRIFKSTNRLCRLISSSARARQRKRRSLPTKFFYYVAKENYADLRRQFHRFSSGMPARHKGLS